MSKKIEAVDYRPSEISRRFLLTRTIPGLIFAGAAGAAAIREPGVAAASSQGDRSVAREILGAAEWVRWSPEVSITATVPVSGVEHVELAKGEFKTTLLPEMRAAFAKPGGYLYHSDGWFNADGTLNVEFIKAVKASRGVIQEGTSDRVQRATGQEEFHWDVPANGWTRFTLAQGTIVTDGFAIRVINPDTTKFVYMRGLYRPARQDVNGNVDVAVIDYETTRGTLPGKSNLLAESVFSADEGNVGFWAEGNYTQAMTDAHRQDKNRGMGSSKVTTAYIDLNTTGAFVVDHTQPRGASKTEAQTIAEDKSRYALRKANFTVA